MKPHVHPCVPGIRIACLFCCSHAPPLTLDWRTEGAQPRAVSDGDECGTGDIE